MNKVIAKPWLSLQCQMIPGVRHAVFAADRQAGGVFATLETWPDGAEAPPEVMESLEAAMASAGTEVREHAGDAADPAARRWIVACPLRRSGKVCGGVAVDVGGLDASQVPVVEQLMNWGSAWPAFLADQDEARQRENRDPGASVAAAALSPGTLRASATAAATALARSHNAGRCAIGLRTDADVSVFALSGRAVFDPRHEQVRQLAAAMNEACDQDTSLVWPAPETGRDAALVTGAQARLAETAEGACVCTVPLQVDGEQTGALILVRSATQPFEPAEVAGIERDAALMASALEVRRRAEQGAYSRLRERVAAKIGRLVGPGHLRLKLGAAACAVVALFLAFAPGTHRVAAQAELAGIVERELVAPADGFVAEAFVRAGARVQAGDLLATLDDEPLRLELKRWQSQRDELSNEYHRALGELDRGSARVLQAQIAQAETQIALVSGTIEQTRIVAPFDGLVVTGDLSQSLGSPVSKGEALFRVAPLEGYRVLLQIDENDSRAVKAGTTGRLVLAALPGEKFEVRVERVNGMARTADGRNVLELEAALVGESRFLRPGMKGAARLDAGRAKLLWIWTHGVFEKLRLWIWAWSPVA